MDYTEHRPQQMTPYKIERRCEQHRSKSNIQRQFGKMFATTCKSWKARYKLDEFKAHLMKISPSDEVSKEISQAGSYMKAVMAVHHLWSWDNYSVFKELVLTIGDADDKQRLELYDRELMQYLVGRERADCDHTDQSSQVGLSYDYDSQQNNDVTNLLVSPPTCTIPKVEKSPCFIDP